MNYPALYKVDYIDYDDCKNVTEHGVFYADDYVDACKKLTDYYGENRIVTMTITLLDDTPIRLNEYWYDKLLHCDSNEIL